MYCIYYTTIDVVTPESIIIAIIKYKAFVKNTER